MARRKTAGVVTDSRQADVQDFLRLFPAFVWMAVGTFYPNNLNRHGIALTILDGRTGEIIPPTPLTIGPEHSQAKEKDRRDLSLENAARLFANADHSVSSQSGKGGAIRAGKYIVSVKGLGGRKNEAIALTTAMKTWSLSNDTHLAVGYKGGPNLYINLTQQFDTLLADYVKDNRIRHFRPDFEELVNFSRLIVS